MMFYTEVDINGSPAAHIPKCVGNGGLCDNAH